LLQHRRDEIAQAHAGKELGIKGVAIHGRFVHELVIEAHLASGLTQDRRGARAERGELLGIFAAARGGEADLMKLLELAGLFVEDFKGGAARAKKPARRHQGVRYAGFAGAARINRFDGLYIKITVRHRL
jgi:hypothetical protein